MVKKRATYTLSPEALRLLAELSGRLGVSMSAVLELAIREFAARHQVTEEQRQ